MPKSSRQKIEYAQHLLLRGETYREIQKLLVEKFGSGMSNSTLMKIQKKTPNPLELLDRIEELDKELALFKRLYFELADVMKSTQKKNKKK